MRIRRRLLPSSFPSLPLPDPQLNRSPVVQHHHHHPPPRPAGNLSVQEGTPRSQPADSPNQSPPPPSDQTLIMIGSGKTRWVFSGSSKTLEVQPKELEGDEEAKDRKRWEVAEKKSNDSKKGGILGAEVGSGLLLQQIHSSPQEVGRWGEGNKVVPPKKRRCSFERRDDEATITMEKEKMTTTKAKMKSKTNKKCGRQNGDDERGGKETRELDINTNGDNSTGSKRLNISNHGDNSAGSKKLSISYLGDNSAASKKLNISNNGDNSAGSKKLNISYNGDNSTGSKKLNMNNNGDNNSTTGLKKLKRGNVIMEGSRCSRVNGRGWRCCQQTLVGYSLCEHHLGKGRLRSMASVRNRAIAAPKKYESESSMGREEMVEKRFEEEEDYDDDEEEEEEEEKPLITEKKVMKKKMMKIGMVKARSISSLLGQTNSAVVVADTNQKNRNI